MESRRPQRRFEAKFCTFYLPCKNRGRAGKMSKEKNEDQSSSPMQMDVLDFKHDVPFRNQTASKATGRKSRPKFRNL